MPKYSALYVLAAMSVATSGCGSLPIAGPLASDVVANKNVSSPSHVDYVVVNVTEKVLQELAHQPKASFRATFGSDAPPPEHTIAVGDTLSITIWEAGTGGLFSNPIPITQAAPSARGVTLPAVVVTQDGEITVPYAGRLSVVGKYPREVESMVVSALQGKAVEPQVVATVTHSVEDSVSVGGEVANGARVPLSVEGDRILDAIAAAGGVRAPVNETIVRLTRNGRTASVPLSTVVEDPRENVYLRPGDDLTLVHLPRTFTAFGALGRNYQIAFEQDSLSAVEGVAKAGGLLDQRADPAGLFILRFEPPSVVRELTSAHTEPGASGTVPVIYRLNLRDAGAYFLASQLLLQDKDIIYVANAPLNELQKFLALVGLAVGPAANAATIDYTLTH
jgi:polysaccharide biosynthesis/export protein